MRTIDSLIAERIRDIADYPRPGVVFKDITPLLGDGAAFRAVVDGLAASHADAGNGDVDSAGLDSAGLDRADVGKGVDRGDVDKVAGIEARGFILAAPVACRLGAGFVPVRKKGKLPAATFSEDYQLEYGTATIEVHQDAFAPSDRVLIVDDVLATGGTARATADLVHRSGATVAGIAVLIELSFLNGRDKLPDLPVSALLTV